MKLTGSDRPIVSHPEHHAWKSSPDDRHLNTAHTHAHAPEPHHPETSQRMDRTTWWSWRGARTRSHPELGRENPQRPWYCVSRHGRVGRRQVFQSILMNTAPHTPAGWSSPVARQAHNLKVTGSNPVPATKISQRTPRAQRKRQARGVPAYGEGRRREQSARSHYRGRDPPGDRHAAGQSPTRPFSGRVTLRPGP